MQSNGVARLDKLAGHNLNLLTAVIEYLTILLELLIFNPGGRTQHEWAWVIFNLVIGHPGDTTLVKSLRGDLFLFYVVRHSL